MKLLIRSSLLTFATTLAVLAGHPARAQSCLDPLTGKTFDFDCPPGQATTVPFINFNPPIACCITITAKGGDIVLDLDQGTIDLGGAIRDVGARAFWDAVRKIAGRDATAQSPDDTMTGPSNLCVGVHDCHMQTHAYTLDDIDRMRKIVHDAVFSENCMKGSDGVYLCPFPPSMAAMVEDRLRTYIAAGIAPEDLERRADGR